MGDIVNVSADRGGDYLVEPEPAPELNLPVSEHTVDVSIVDSGTRINFPVSAMLVPDSIGSFSRFTFPSWAFLIKHAPSKKMILFDLGMRDDWENLPPKLVKSVKSHDPPWKPGSVGNVVDELKRGGVDINKGEIDTVIWSHYHWDHTGDMTLFPKSTKLLVGPGFKKRFPVAWPTDEDAPLREDAWKDRDLVELSFEKSDTEADTLKIGRFRALDYFGDGSFYLLDAPGHCVGHICGLARTTRDTFIFMGGDASHHVGCLRPTKWLPLPKSLKLDPPPNGNYDPPTRIKFPIPCPGELIVDKMHPRHSAISPFLEEKPGFNDDDKVAKWTAEGLREFDASDQVFMVVAHDPTLKDVIETFPAKANDWKSQGWARQVEWRFIASFADALEE